MAKWLAWPATAHSSDFFLNFIKRSLHDYADGKALVCGIFFADNLVGNISFNTINHVLKKVEIGYWLSAEYQGRGIVTKAASALIALAFTTLDMRKVQISVAVENLPSQRVCQRLGFSKEGVITHAEYLHGRIVDHAVYGLHKHQWAASQ